MKRIICFLTLFLSVFCYQAQAQNAAQARKVLDRTASIISSKNGATANFTMSSKNIGSASGTITIKGNKFYASTPNIKVWNNGNTQWTYTRSTNEVTIIRPNDAQQMAVNPYKFISIYKKGYRMSMKNVGSNKEVHLVAIHPSRSIKEIYITINSKYYPTQVRMRQGKTWTNIRISNLRTRGISNSIFEFNKKAYPSAEIVDLR